MPQTLAQPSQTTATTPPTQTQSNTQFNGQQAVLVSLTFKYGAQGGCDKGLTQKINEDNDATALRAVKSYICKEALDPLKKKSSKIRRRINMLTMPWDIDGMRLCSSLHLPKVIEIKDDGFSELQDLKNNHVINNYFKWKELTRKENGNRFVDAEFPTIPQLKEGITWSISTTPLTDSAALKHLRGVNQQMLDDLVKQNEARYAKVREEIQEQAWAALAEPVQKIVETLSKDKPRILDSLIGNIHDIVERLPGLNFNNDPEMSEMAQNIQQQLGGVDVNDLRKSVQAREQALKKAKNIAANFGKVGKRNIG